MTHRTPHPFHDAWGPPDGPARKHGDEDVRDPHTVLILGGVAALLASAIVGAVTIISLLI